MAEGQVIKVLDYTFSPVIHKVLKAEEYTGTPKVPTKKIEHEFVLKGQKGRIKGDVYVGFVVIDTSLGNGKTYLEVYKMDKYQYKFFKRPEAYKDCNYGLDDRQANDFIQLFKLMEERGRTNIVLEISTPRIKRQVVPEPKQPYEPFNPF